MNHERMANRIAGVSVPRTMLGNTGLEVGRLGLGTAWYEFGRLSNHDVREVVYTYLDAGCNLLDTASDYGDGDAEVLLGKAIKGNRDKFVIVTKCGHKRIGSEGEDFTPSIIRSNIESSLWRLETDYLDVVLLHTNKQPDLWNGDALGELVALRDKGLIRHVGYSGDNYEAAFACTLEDVDVLETSVNICDQANIPLLSVAREYGVGILAKRAIADGAWKGASQHDYAIEYAAEYATRLKALGIEPHDFGLENEDYDWVKLFLGFTLSQDIDVALVQTTNPKHAAENVMIATLAKDFELFKQMRVMWQNAEEGISNFKTGRRWFGKG